jgi:hypothetical protein
VVFNLMRFAHAKHEHFALTSLAGVGHLATFRHGTDRRVTNLKKMRPRKPSATVDRHTW